MNTFVTSDHHFYHKNVIHLCDRPFSSIAEHDQKLMDEWNSVVHPDDTVYYLGDFTLSGSQIADKIFRQLNGIVICLNNNWHHDKRWIKAQVTYETKTGLVRLISPIQVLDNFADVPIVLCHYPFEVWDRKHYGAIHFHGHSHGMLPKILNRLDVGVDVASKLTGHYRPFYMEEAIEWAREDKGQ
jgi:calcineurin-like phosphoesterase family protein